MGAHPNIRHDKFPKQGTFLGTRVKVVFHFNTKEVLMGTVVRDDTESPGELLIHLDNGNYVRSVECQYQPWVEDKPKTKHRSKGYYLEKYGFTYEGDRNRWKHPNGSVVLESKDGYIGILRTSESGIKQFETLPEMDEEDILHQMKTTDKLFPGPEPEPKLRKKPTKK